MSDLYTEALELLAATPDTIKSDMWTGSLAERGRDNFRDAPSFIEWLTSVNSFNKPRLRDDPIAFRVITEWLGHIAKIPVGESPHACPQSIFDICGQRVSSVLLQYTYYAQRIETVSPDTILEIGAGYGGLARILSTIRSRRYTILDIPSSLFCSYVYLKTHFPDRKFCWMTCEEDWPTDADFVFMPAYFAGSLKSQQYDMAINTCSMGEMLTEQRDRYMSLIQRTSKHFYSHNRHGDKAPPPDTAIPAIVLDDKWEVLFEEIEGAGQTDPETPASRELLLRRL